MNGTLQDFNWGKGLTLAEKTKKAVLEVLSEGTPRQKGYFFYQFWLRGFQTTSSALSRQLDNLLDEGKIKCVKIGITLMGGDNSTYKIAEDAKL